MIFKEYASLYSQKKKTIGQSDHSIKEQVELEVDTLIVQSNNPYNEV